MYSGSDFLAGLAGCLSASTEKSDATESCRPWSLWDWQSLIAFRGLHGSSLHPRFCQICPGFSYFLVSTFFDFWIINGYFYLWHDLNLPTLFTLISVLLCACRFVGPSGSTCRIKYKSVWRKMTRLSSFLLSPSLSQGECSLDSTEWKHMFVCMRPKGRIILGEEREKNKVLMPSLVMPVLKSATDL